MTALRPVLFVAVVAAAVGPVPLVASPYTDAVETAVFTICPQLRAGMVAAEQEPGALARLGYWRQRDLEEDWTDAEDGAPFVFRRGRGVGAVTIGYWAYPRLCSVSFAGRQAAAAAERLRARLSAAPRTYRREPAADYVLGDVRHEAWRVAGVDSACLAIDGPTADSTTTTYDVRLEPLPPLHPGLAMSACAPAGERR